jgi:Ca2+-binding EF-hand superfamily protein
MDHLKNHSMLLACSLLGGMAFAAWANHPNDKFKTMDTDGDNMVSATEHAAGVKAMFAKMDADGDGNVTAAEMDASMKMKDNKGMRHVMSSADKIKTMDTNGDGMLSAAEHDAGAQQKFAEMDTDKDGSLSRQEMQAGHRMMKQDMKPETKDSGT